MLTELFWNNRKTLNFDNTIKRQTITTVDTNESHHDKIHHIAFHSTTETIITTPLLTYRSTQI